LIPFLDEQRANAYLVAAKKCGAATVEVDKHENKAAPSAHRDDIRLVFARSSRMPEMGAPPDWAAGATLIVVSFLAFIAGAVFRTWPDKVRERVASLDGSLTLLTPEAHLAFITFSAWALTAASAAALVAAALVL